MICCTPARRSGCRDSSSLGTREPDPTRYGGYSVSPHGLNAQMPLHQAVEVLP